MRKPRRSAHAHGFVHERGNRQRAGRALLRGARLREDCDCLPAGCAELLPAVGELTGKFGNSISCIRISGETGRSPIEQPRCSTPVDQLDLATVIKVSEAVSGEIVLEKLIDTLMRTAIEHAGAERGLLILPRGDEYRIEAEATTSSNEVNVELRQASVTAADLPESVFRYVLRTKESVLLPDASGQNPFSVRRLHSRAPRPVGPLPADTQADPTARDAVPGKQPHASRVSPPHEWPSSSCSPRRPPSRWRTRACTVTSPSARPESDAWWTANIIGIIIWDLQGRILEANDAFLAMVGYDREDLVSGRVGWTDMTPPEWRERDEQQRRPQLKATGTARSPTRRSSSARMAVVSRC